MSLVKAAMSRLLARYWMRFWSCKILDMAFGLNVGFCFLYWDFECDKMDLSFGALGLNHHGMMNDAFLSRSPSREQGGCWGYSRARLRDIYVTAFGVSTGTMAMFLWSFASSCGAHHHFYAIHLFRTTVVYVCTLVCSTFRMPAFEPIPAQPKTRGAGDECSLPYGSRVPSDDDDDDGDVFTGPWSQNRLQ